MISYDREEKMFGWPVPDPADFKSLCLELHARIPYKEKMK